MYYMFSESCQCHNKYSFQIVIKQGGVLSPILFSIYTDRLLILLKKSGIGCHLNGTYCGVLAYADDPRRYKVDDDKVVSQCEAD